MIRRPTTVEPVNETLSTSGCDASSSPTVAPPPVIDVDHALGQVGLVEQLGQHAARSAACSSAGFSTHVLPIASAGASFHTAITSGKFHGMIAGAHADRLAQHEVVASGSGT